MKRTKLRIKGISDTATAKQDIQDIVRDIVIKRDGGCWARDLSWHTCNGYRKDGQLILQADHMETRSNSATYADTRLIVCVCKGLHGWKKWNERQYNDRLREVLSPERVTLWDAAHADRYKVSRTSAHDWQLELAALKQEYAQMV